MEIGISTFVERTPDPSTGITIAPAQRLADLLEEAVVLEQAGLDVFAVGEHHRPDFVASAPAVMLAAIAAQTKKIKLSSAVTVLSSDDPVRVFQEFATVDLISQGRAEIMAGRGSFIESFPLFGYNLDDYDALFAEKLDLLVQLTKSEKVNWQGKHRAAIRNLGVYPRPFQEQLPVWVAVGGTPQSVIRAAKYGLPLALAIIGGSPEHFVPLVNLYKEEYEKAGHDLAKMQIGVHSHGYIAEESDQAALEFYPSYQYVMTQLGKERGWPPMSPQQYQGLRSKHGSLLVGDPNEVTDKILHYHELFGLTRFLLHISVGTLPHKQVLHAIELLGSKVKSAVNKALGQ